MVMHDQREDHRAWSHGGDISPYPGEVMKVVKVENFGNAENSFVFMR